MTVAVLFALIILSSPARAEDLRSAALQSNCWTSAGLGAEPTSLARNDVPWDCSSSTYSLVGERVALRFDLERGAEVPRYLFTRRAAMDAVHVLTIAQDGTVARNSVPWRELDNARSGGFIKVALPAMSKPTRQVIVAFDKPSHVMTLERAYLAPADIATGVDRHRMLFLLAGLCGMLIMPLVFNAAFYRILREPFVVWHSILALSLLLTIIVSSGLAVELTTFRAMTLSWMSTMIFGFTVASGAMFTYHFVEPGMIHPRLRRALPISAACALMLSSFHAAFPYVARPIQSVVYTAAFAPVIVIFIWSMIDALKHGSRAAKFQAIGYAPMIGVGVTRLISGVVPSIESNDAMLLFYMGCAFEVLLTTMGVADRFMAIKRQRDEARTEADILERLSECDPLTGLLNRRVLEQGFEAYRADGFDVIAVLDLDYFKAVNDLHGHQTGDAVLQAAAEALRSNNDARAFRIGGEEFVLLLRGDEAFVQAERLRQAIPSAVAHSVPGLNAPVTASMGVAQIGAEDRGYTALYERADRLLYEAKAGGRNRAKVDCGAEVTEGAPAQDSLAA